MEETTCTCIMYGQITKLKSYCTENQQGQATCRMILRFLTGEMIPLTNNN